MSTDDFFRARLDQMIDLRHPLAVLSKNPFTILVRSPNRVQSVLADAGYTGAPFAQGIREILGAHVTAQIAKRNELNTFKVLSKPWVVERSVAWLEKNRRLWKNCERWLNTSLQFVHLAFLALLLRRS